MQSLGVQKLILLLRGINVGGVKIPMSELKSCLEEAGFSQVETLLNTGNVVCLGSPHDAVELSERVLGETFSYDAKVIALTPTELTNCLDQWPWSDLPETSHRYIVFGDDDTLLDELIEIGQPSKDERLARGPGCVYWVVPKGETLGTGLSKLFAKVRYKKATTTRNLNTVEKLVALAQK